MLKSTRLPLRKLVVLFLAIPALIFGAVTFGVPSAGAAAPQLTAHADCSANVSFTATAGDPSGSDADRTSQTVDVQYSTNGDAGPFVSVRGEQANQPDGNLYTFAPANNFTFADHFVLPSSEPRPSAITLRVVASTQPTSELTLSIPGPCGEVTATVSAPSCSNPNAQVVLTNTGTEPEDFRFYRDASDTPFQTVTVANGTQVVNVPVNEAFLLSVQGADNTSKLQQAVAVPTGCSSSVQSQDSNATTTTTLNATTTSTLPPATAPTSTGSISTAGYNAACASDALGWNVTFDNTKNQTVVDYVLRDNLGNIVASQLVPGGHAVTAEYSFASVKGTSLSIVADNVVLATGPTKTQCVNTAASIVPACNTVAGNGALLAFVNVGLVPETFTVTRDGKPVVGSPFTIQPSHSVVMQKLLPVNSTETTDIKITGNSGYMVEKRVSVNCGAASTASKGQSGLTKTKNSSSTLAYTGIDLRPEITLGAVLIAIGGALSYASVDLSFINRCEGVKSEASGMRLVFAPRARLGAIREWFDALVAPKGKHARRRRE
jgi:hypothetical protein